MDMDTLLHERSYYCVNEGIMLKEKLKVDYDWHKLASEDQDLRILDPRESCGFLFMMCVIREFETEILNLKEEDCVWGPVHSSIGQEAVAAAAISALRRDDKITGSHRAHHQFIVKALRYVLPDHWNPITDDVPASALEVVRRTMAEIMGLSPGYCGGRGGSMHLRYPEAGILGTNAIVGGGIPAATGAAFAEKRKKTGNVVVCFFGDGAINQGSFHEACNLAGLWRLPIIYFIENNEYAVATRADQATAVEDLSLRGIAYNLKSVTVAGNDVVGLYQAVFNAAEELREGGRPYLIEAKCYRHFHHAGGQPGSTFGYRKIEEEQEWLQKDPLNSFPEKLKEAEIIDADDVSHIQELAKECVKQAVTYCTVGIKPFVVRPELWPNPESAASGLHSDGSELEKLDYKSKDDFVTYEEMRYVEAISAVTGRWLARDERVVVLGEEVANFGGGAYAATRGLPVKHPDQVLNTPISEAGFVGLAGGAAISGLKTIVEIMFPDFTLVAADQVLNQIAKIRHMYGGKTDVSLIARTRVAIGLGYGAQHSMDPVGIFTLFPGWRVVAPSDAFDYVGLFNTAMYSNDPVLFIEHHSLYENKYPVPQHDLDFCVPFGKANILREGGDVTVVTYGVISERMRNLIPQLTARGIDLEFIDLRTLDSWHLDYDTIMTSVKKTGVLIIIEEAPGSVSIGHRISSKIDAMCFDYLDGPICCLSSLDIPPSVSRVLEKAALVSDEQMLERIEAVAKRRWR